MESTYLLHAATGDARYLQAGRTMQRTLLKRSKAACGFASLADTASGALTCCCHAASFCLQALDVHEGQQMSHTLYCGTATPAMHALLSCS